MRPGIRLFRQICAVLLIAAGLPAKAAFIEAEAVNIIAYRQVVMRSLDSHVRAIAAITTDKVAFWYQVGDHAVAISGMSRALLELFPHWTRPPRGNTRALPGIWQDWPAFEAAALAFNKEAVQLVASVHSIDRQAIRAQFARVEKSCNDCHDVFLERDE